MAKPNPNKKTKDKILIMVDGKVIGEIEKFFHEMIMEPIKIPNQEK